MADGQRRALVLCTGNSCRSIIAEALVNHLTDGRWRADSAGSQPTGAVHPGALAILRRHGIDPGTPVSESWNRYAGEHFDLVVTVCDNAAGEACPLFTGPRDGQPARMHWGVPDPASAAPAEQDAAFERAFQRLRHHVLEDLPA